MTKVPTLRQLLPRREVRQWLSQLADSDTSLALAILQNNGKVFTSAGCWPQESLTKLSEMVVCGLPTAPPEDANLFPLQVAGVTFGVLAAADGIDSKQFALAEAVHRGLELVLAEAVEKLDLADEALEGYREVNLLYRISETISATLEPMAIPPMILEHSLQVIKAPIGVVVTFADHGWHIVAASGVEDWPELHRVIDLVRVNHRVGNKPAIITDLEEAGSEFCSLLWAPMASTAGVMSGIILLRRTDSKVFVAGEEKLLLALARQASVATDNAQLFEETRTYAMHLQKLNRVSREISASLDVAVVIDRYVESAVELAQAEAGALFMKAEDETGFSCRQTVGCSQGFNGKPNALVGDLVDDVARSGTCIIVNRSSTTEAGFQDLEGAFGFSVGTVIAVPTLRKKALLGILILLNKEDGTVYDSRDQMLLETLASQAAVALENARLHEATLVSQRMERDLLLGFEMQSSLIPTNVPVLDGWEFSAWWQPAREVSGDFYDFLELPGSLGVVIADVADKGVQAALFMALTRSLVRASISTDQDPSGSLNRANTLIASDAPKGMFVTLFYARFEPGGRVTYVNAGHNPPLHYKARDDRLLELEPTGIFLGLEAGIPLEQRVVEFEAGDFVLLFTDGITEAMNGQREEFGEDRLAELLLANRNGTAQDLRNVLLSELSTFVGDTAQSDDITLVVAKRTDG